MKPVTPSCEKQLKWKMKPEKLVKSCSNNALRVRGSSHGRSIIITRSIIIRNKSLPRPEEESTKEEQEDDN